MKDDEVEKLALKLAAGMGSDQPINISESHLDLGGDELNEAYLKQVALNAEQQEDAELIEIVNARQGQLEIEVSIEDL